MRGELGYQAKLDLLLTLKIARDSQELTVNLSQEHRVVRSAASEVALLVPVWGYSFVCQFLEFSLPTLLAPGNIPGVVGILPFRVIALSSEADEPLIRSHPNWQRLQHLCPAEIRLIDDLITDGNHSATITLAFARAMQNCGLAIVDTCFILWMCDYLVADGSLNTLIRHFQKGASAILAGNFQIVAEDAAPLLRNKIDPDSSAIAITSRELIAWSLGLLHPATAANIINFGLIHNAHINRLFWRVDEETLIGRFYLMHPIGVRPEIGNCEVGASFDYSFIPEMCPSDNIIILTDSDDYCVVEMQRRDHEEQELLPGPIRKERLANSLSQWTTAQHRSNARRTIVFHAGETPSNLDQTVAEADGFINGVERLLAPEPCPHRGHPYWVGSIAVNRARTGRMLSKADWRFLLDDAAPDRWLAKLIRRLRLRIVGTLPEVTRFHPRWPDYQPLYQVLKRAVSDNHRLLLVADQAVIFSHWLVRTSGNVATLEIDRLLDSTRQLYRPLIGNFDTCVIVLSEEMLGRADELVERASSFLARSGQISIVIMNDRPHAESAYFARAFIRHAARLLSLSSWVSETRYIRAGRLRWSIYHAMRRLSERGEKSGWGSPMLPRLALSAAPLAVVTYLLNVKTSASLAPYQGTWSSVFLVLRRSDRKLLSSGRFGDERRRGDNAALEEHNLVPAARPSQSAAVLARYNFVAQLLARRHDVAEYGCIDDLGSRMVLQKVRKLSLYDPDPKRIGEIPKELYELLQFAVYAHDVGSAPLPKMHDAIYSLDTLPYVSRSDEDRYLRNLCRSLSRPQDILIIGCASFAGSDDGAAGWDPAFPAARGSRDRSDSEWPAESSETFDVLTRSRPYPRTGAMLKALLERYFETVFLFSMAGLAIRPGAPDEADYLFALCSHKKG
jgi:hypothetical protein